MTIPKRNLGESEQWGRAAERELSDIWRRLRALEGGRRISSKSQSILADLVARNSIQDQLLQDELDFQNTVTYANTPPTEDIDDPGDPDEDGEVFPPPDSEEGENPANPGDIEEGGDDEDPYPDFEENEIEPLPNDRWVYVDPETGRVEGEWELIDEVWEARQMGTGGIAPGAIDVDRIADDAITAQKIADDAVVAGKIAAEAVNSNAIQNAAIVADKLASNAVTETKISDNAISTPKLQANAVEASKIAANAVVAGKIAANAVDADQIAANAVQAGKISANAVQAGNIAAGAVTTGKLAANAVTSEKIEALAIEADHLAANAVTADKILANAVGTEKLAADAVTADKIAANAVTADSIRGNAIDGMTITGATLQSSSATNTGVKIVGTNIRLYGTQNGYIYTTTLSSSLPGNRGSGLEFRSNRTNDVSYINVSDRQVSGNYISELKITAPGSSGLLLLSKDSTVIQTAEGSGLEARYYNSYLLGAGRLDTTTHPYQQSIYWTRSMTAGSSFTKTFGVPVPQGTRVTFGVAHTRNPSSLSAATMAPGSSSNTVYFHRINNTSTTMYFHSVWVSTQWTP